MGNDSTTLKQTRNVEEYDQAFTFTEKWENDYKFTQIPTTLIHCQKHLKLTDRELVVLIQLLTHWYRADNDVFPSITRLAKFSGKGYSTVQGNLVSLEKKGFIMIDRRLGYTSTYDFGPCVRKLEYHTDTCADLGQ